MDRGQLIRTLMDEYAVARVRNRAEAEERLRQAEQRDPEIRDIRARASAIVLSALGDMSRTDDAEQRRAISDKMRSDGLENNTRLREHLERLGYPPDHLEERYRCPKCRDTGYTNDIPARFCECFERALRLRVFEDGSMAGLDEQNFARFDEQLVRRANQPGDADILLAARDYCRAYAESFPDNKIPNILLMGHGGAGKTFLLNCIFARVLERGLSAVRVTAYRMHEVMRRRHFGEEGGGEAFEGLIEAPMLLIDDLGTEPMLNNITVEYLFTLVNERGTARRQTVIATNLSPANLRERYGERVSSRIMDRSRCVTITFNGNDLRLS